MSADGSPRYTSTLVTAAWGKPGRWRWFRQPTIRFGVVQWMHEMLVRRLVRLEQSRSGEVHVLVVDDKRSPKVGHRCLL